MLDHRGEPAIGGESPRPRTHDPYPPTTLGAGHPVERTAIECDHGIAARAHHPRAPQRAGGEHPTVTGSQPHVVTITNMMLDTATVDTGQTHRVRRPTGEGQFAPQLQPVHPHPPQHLTTHPRRRTPHRLTPDPHTGVGICEKRLGLPQVIAVQHSPAHA